MPPIPANPRPQKADIAILRALFAARNCDRSWVRPADIGGTTGSDHSHRLNRLVRMKLAIASPRSSRTGTRGSKRYQITDAGVELLTNLDPDNGDPQETTT